MSPVRNIPSFEETRKRTPARNSQPTNNEDGREGLLIDFDTPAQPPMSSAEDASNPFDAFNAEAIRDEMAATREREEKERRERERKAVLEHREARRKSMGMAHPPSGYNHITNRRKRTGESLSPQRQHCTHGM